MTRFCRLSSDMSLYLLQTFSNISKKISSNNYIIGELFMYMLKENLMILINSYFFINIHSKSDFLRAPLFRYFLVYASKFLFLLELCMNKEHKEPLQKLLSVYLII